ncbi:uncharacterized protein LOC113272494 [Papaver somniferum]|uniref:uncharacterized protein LOC113272494 n=1 Tax=Papaver somniferum TaxID=3469 RepID=UPI000E6FB3F2|nr:uncharacterized protein LOC113272494 [Papaver somniferum]
MGFGFTWRNWICSCISHAHFSVLVNGVPGANFRSSRGLRLGDPLYPFLFTIVMEGFCRMIAKAEENGRLSGFKVTLVGPVVSHLLFADDTLLFSADKAQSLLTIREILTCFELVAGLSINLMKRTTISIGATTHDEVVENFLGCALEELRFKYLGMPAWAYKCKKIWDPVVESVEKRLEEWKRRIGKYKLGILHKVANGRKIRFWVDRWIGEEALKDKFPNLYEVTRKQGSWISELAKNNSEERISRDLDFKIRLTDLEINEAATLSHLLEGTVLSNGEDTRRWSWESSGVFSVKSCYKGLAKNSGIIFPSTQIWKRSVPTKVSFFVWLIHHNAILTQNNLKKKGWKLANRCILCKSNEETIDHLFIHCPEMYDVWMFFMKEFHRDWVISESATNLFIEQQARGLTENGRTIWELLPFAFVWGVWKQRNKCIFQDSEYSQEILIRKIKALLLYWTSTTISFRGITYQNLHYN